MGRGIRGALVLAGLLGLWALGNWLLYRAQQTPQVIAERTRGTRSQLDTSQRVLERFKARFGRYPASLDEADDRGFGIFERDMHRHAFVYRAGADGQSYRLVSVGPDGREGTGDDLVREVP